jgi:hypothetical protein
MRAAEYFSKCRAVGSAVWLLNLYWALSKPDELPWFLVNGGAPVPDTEVGEYLGVSVHTVARWKRRLSRAGLVKARGSHKTRILVLRPLFTMTSASQSSDQPVQADWPKMTTEWVQ